MNLSRVVVVLAAVVALASCSKMTIQPTSTPTSIVPKQIWSGSSGGFAILWTTGDITAHPTNAPATQALSEIGRTVVDFHAITRHQTSDCDMTRQARLQSVVGSVVSIQSADTMKCANGVNGTGLGIVAIDLAHPQKPVSLADLFPAHELAALRTKAAHFCKAVPGDLLGRFAFSELHGATVIVAVTLPPDCTESEVDLALGVPKALQQPLTLAAQRQQGFLLHDQRAIADGLATTVNYHYRTAVQ
jgi:hypothetical protein